MHHNQVRRFELKGLADGQPIPQWPCASEEQALEKAFELFSEQGSAIRLEILLNENMPPLWNERRMAKGDVPSDVEISGAALLALSR